jgi:hypothetical protein
MMSVLAITRNPAATEVASSHGPVSSRHLALLAATAISWPPIRMPIILYCACACNTSATPWVPDRYRSALQGPGVAVSYAVPAGGDFPALIDPGGRDPSPMADVLTIDLAIRCDGVMSPRIVILRACSPNGGERSGQHPRRPG